jgi:SAM-dependent methyltransferase
MLKNIFKSILPMWLRPRVNKVYIRFFGYENQYRNMNNSEIFDNVYKNAVWGKATDGHPISGSGSVNNEVIGPYIENVNRFLSEVKPAVVVDIGCGDFNVGSHFVELADRYIACDVSSHIIDINRKKFADIPNLEFRQLDLGCDELPGGDVAFVRQVLQHLSNESIQRFVSFVNENKPYKYLVVTEHLPASDSFTTNLDKPSGPNIRIGIDSGIVLDQAPFFLKSKTSRTMVQVPETSGGTKAYIKTILYEL